MRFRDFEHNLFVLKCIYHVTAQILQTVFKHHEQSCFFFILYPSTLSSSLLLVLHHCESLVACQTPPRKPWSSSRDLKTCLWNHRMVVCLTFWRMEIALMNLIKITQYPHNSISHSYMQQ